MYHSLIIKGDKIRVWNGIIIDEFFFGGSQGMLWYYTTTVCSIVHILLSFVLELLGRWPAFYVKLLLSTSSA